MITKTPKALYVHIPFCSQICFYCGFTRILFREKIADQYLDVLCQQIDEISNTCTTIYVGGGTPTALTDQQFERLLLHLQPLADIKQCEFTVEANPDSLSDEKCALMVKYGVNRVSMGVQCSQDRLLKAVNRAHDFPQVIECVKRLRHFGIDNFSMDLMYGFQGQTMDDLKQSITDITSLQPNHISIYALTIEENSVFGKQHMEPVDNETESEMYLYAIEALESLGYHHYEISNFAKTGFESQHNQVYWHYQPYYALGSGATRMMNQRRQTYIKSVMKYIQSPSFDEDLELSESDERFEFVMMGLRMKKGILKKDFFDRFGVSIDEVFTEAIQEATKKHLLINDEDVLKTTQEGFVMLFDTLLYFMDE